MVKLFVGNLSDSVTIGDLRQLFVRFGQVIEAEYVEKRGYGFVYLDNEQGVAEAIRVLNGVKFKGMPLKIEKSDTNPDVVESPASLRNAIQPRPNAPPPLPLLSQSRRQVGRPILGTAPPMGVHPKRLLRDEIAPDGSYKYRHRHNDVDAYHRPYHRPTHHHNGDPSLNRDPYVSYLDKKNFDSYEESDRAAIAPIPLMSAGPFRPPSIETTYRPLMPPYEQHHRRPVLLPVDAPYYDQPYHRDELPVPRPPLNLRRPLVRHPPDEEYYGYKSGYADDRIIAASPRIPPYRPRLVDQFAYSSYASRPAPYPLIGEPYQRGNDWRTIPPHPIRQRGGYHYRPY